MKTHSLLLATFLSLPLTSTANSQESLAERQLEIQPFRYPEIQRVTELPAAGDARRFELELAETELPHEAPPRYGENHWKEGMIAGGLITLMLLLATASENGGTLPLDGFTVGVTLGVGTVLALVGGLIGGAIPK